MGIKEVEMVKKEIILLLLILVHFGWRVWGYRHRYFQPFDPDYWRERYLKSQWVMAEPEETIGDDGLYAHAGWEYIHGRDPSTLNAEMPPLGKYFIGLTILVFGNENIFALLVGFLALAAFYAFSFYLFKNRFWALLATGLFSLEPLFWTQLRAPFLDTLHLVFLLLTFFFFLKKNFWASSFFLGCFLTTKAPFSSFLLPVATMGLALVVKKNKPGLKKWLVSLLLVPWVVVLVYLRYFQLGHNIKDFLSLQKWVFDFYRQGARAQIGSVWFLLFWGRWQTWWQTESLRIGEWHFGWSILIFIFLISIFRWKKILATPGLALVWLWLVIYWGFLNFIPVWPRYLLIWLPFGYNVLVWSGRAWLKKKS